MYALPQGPARIFRRPTGFDFLPIVMNSKRRLYFDGQHVAHGFVTQHGRPWHSLRGQSYWRPLRRVHKQFLYNIPPRSSRLRQRRGPHGPHGAQQPDAPQGPHCARERKRGRERNHRIRKRYYANYRMKM